MSPARPISEDREEFGQPISNPCKKCSCFMGPKLKTTCSIQRSNEHVRR